MNTRALWAYALVCTLDVGLLHASNQGEETVKAMSGRLEKTLEEFDQAPNGRTLASFVEELYGFHSTQDPQSSVRSFKNRSIVRILSAVGKKIDPQFDPNDIRYVPLRNVAPPGREYPSGVAPSAIEDEKVRKEYEAAIAANNSKAAVFNLQLELGRLKERILSMLESLASYAGADKSEFTSLLDEYGIDAQSRTRILGSGQRSN